MGFEYPWALILLTIIPAVIFLKRRYTVRRPFTAVNLIHKALGPSVLRKYGHEISESFFLFSLILALANIQYSSVWQKTYLESKWIMIVQDLSGSMNRPSFEGGHLTLGDITLEAVKSFIDMREKQDLIGLTAFSSYAKLITPPTFDKKILKQRLDLLNRKKDSIVFRELTVGGATNASYAAWLALCSFFMLLPEDRQPSFEALKDMRHSLLGRTLRRLKIPEQLNKGGFGHGMAIVMFTDGRIKANSSDEDVKKGLPNFVNVVKLIKQLGIKFYLIVAGGDVTRELKDAIDEPAADSKSGQIFYMPRAFDLGKIKEVYRKINEMEKNRLLTKLEIKKKETRWFFSCASFLFLFINCCFRLSPASRRL